MLKAVLIGKSNTGKSTLFNRFVQSRSIVFNDFCTTRDVKYSHAIFGDLQFLLGDSCGIDLDKNNDFRDQVMKINKQAILESDIVLFVLDNRMLQNIDFDFVKFIISHSKKCIILVNKIELISAIDASHFKFAKNYPIVEISAKHKIGFKELYSNFGAMLSNAEFSSSDDSSDLEANDIKMTICGRPNVGKSSFINSIVGYDRLITSKVSGTTSDSIEISFPYKNHQFKIFDTSGLKRKVLLTQKNSNKLLGYFSAQETFKAIDKSHIAILMLDATEQLSLQDLKIANYILERNKALIVAVNKLDVIQGKKSLFYKTFKDELEFKIPQTKNIYLSFISAKNHERLYEPLDIAIEIFSRARKRISTSKINQWIKNKTEQYPLPFSRSFGRRVKIKYLTQISSFPIKFKVFVNFPELISSAYKRYLVNSLVVDFDLKSVPVDMIFVKSTNPYIK